MLVILPRDHDVKT